MENSGMDPTNQKGLVDELVEGRDLTKQLYSILLKESSSSTTTTQPSSSSSSTNEALPSLYVTQKILSKIERSLNILRHDPTNRVQSQATDSPNSINGTPKSPDSEGDSKDALDSKDESRKRKVIQRSTLRVQGCCKSGLEVPVDDGCSWRKYGQKDILGAKFPRAYYRCTQRSQGCYATKQVQRSDTDPTFFEVTYRGKHTCYQAFSASSSSSIMPPFSPPKPEPGNASSSRFQPQEILWSFETNPNPNDDIKPVVTTTIHNHLKSSSSFPPHHISSSTQYSFLHNNSHYYYSSSLFSPRMVRNNNNNNNNNNTATTDNDDNNALDITSELFSFDHGELETDFNFGNPLLYRE